LPKERYNETRKENGCSICPGRAGETPPPSLKGWKKEMKRTYVFRLLFAALAIAGMLMVFGSAGASDLGLIGNGELFLRGGAGAFFVFAGIRGAVVCDRAIEASRRARLRSIRCASKACRTAA
jgi:hypothetical protein